MEHTFDALFTCCEPVTRRRSTRCLRRRRLSVAGWSTSEKSSIHLTCPNNGFAGSSQKAGIVLDVRSEAAIGRCIKQRRDQEFVVGS
jgi:hypothetical protein